MRENLIFAEFNRPVSVLKYRNPSHPVGAFVLVFKNLST